MTAAAIATARERARIVMEDAAEDAAALDGTPLTGAGVGNALGTQLAMIAALARSIVELADALEAVTS